MAWLEKVAGVGVGNLARAVGFILDAGVKRCRLSSQE